MKMGMLALIILTLSGCAYIDWAGPWFGCPKGQIKKPATYGMFGTVKQSARCIPADESAYPVYSAEHRAQLKKDFAECRALSPNGQVNHIVDACMEKKGWKP
jgi:hypothetical protein